MKTTNETVKRSDQTSQNILECGGKPSATPLLQVSRPDEKRRRRCALPAQSKTWRRLVVPLMLLVAVLNASAQNYSIDWFTIDGGGGNSTGGVYSVSGTIGQPDAGGPMTGGTYSLTGGFWALPIGVPTPGAPTLQIVRGAVGFATVSWNPSTPGFVLQHSDSLTTPNWSDAPGGTSNPTTVSATLPKKFYRLRGP